MIAILIKSLLASKGTKKGIKGLFAGLGSALVLIACLLSIFQPSSTLEQDPYKIAIKQVMREQHVTSSHIAPSTIRSIDFVLYQYTSSRTSNDIALDITTYYLEQETKQQEVCEDVMIKDKVEKKCSTITVELVKFKNTDTILNTLKLEKQITDAQESDIRMLLELAKEGKFDLDGNVSGSPIPTTGGFILPTSSGTVTCGYGCYPGHIGTDIGSYAGTDIFVVADGVIIDAQSICVEGDTSCGGGYGNNVKVAHLVDGKPFVTIYAHMLEGSVQVQIGEQVKQGTVLGGMGNTGRSEGVHVHFEILAGIDYFPVSKTERIGYAVDTETVLEYPKFW